METPDRAHLPPLTELVFQIEFDVYGLSSPYLGLKLRGLHYGLDEQDGQIVGLMLCYAQRAQGSPQVLVVESSIIPPNIDPLQPSSRTQWSLESLVNLEDCLLQLHQQEPRFWQDEEALEQAYQEELEQIRLLSWVQADLARPGVGAARLEFARAQQEIIFGRRFEGLNMLLVGSLGLHSDQFLEAIQLLAPLQTEPHVILRHQEEFELLTQEE